MNTLEKVKHTPGPWVADSPCPTSVWAEQSNAQVASCDWSLECPNCGAKEIDYRAGRYEFNAREVREANARLIAAAPELLAACKLALSGTTHPLIEPALKAAIAKAEGQ